MGRRRRSTLNTRRRRTVIGEEPDPHRFFGGVESCRDRCALVDEDFEHGVVAPGADAQGLCFFGAGYWIEGCEESMWGSFWFGVDESVFVEGGAGDDEGFGGGGE